MVRRMYRFVLLVALVASCASDDETCGTLTLSLPDNGAAYPTDVALACDLQTGGVWDKVMNDATIVLTDSTLPADAYVSAHLPLDKVKPGAMLVVPTGIAGEAYTMGEMNHAFLTTGTVAILQDFGTDPKANAHVFEVRWDLEWLGTGTYRSAGEARVWFLANHGL